MKLYYICDGDGIESIDCYSHDEAINSLTTDVLIRGDTEDEWTPLAEHPDFRGAKIRRAKPVKRMEGVQVFEHFRDWKPLIDVRKVVQRLLRGLSSQYTAGLGSVVLSNASGFNRERRRRKTRARGRKVAVSEVRGLYHQSWKGDPAWIELFVDNIFAGEPACAWKLGFWRDWIIGCTLCHEIGHHLHATRAPEYRDREDVAEKWELKLAYRLYRRYHFVAAELGVVVTTFMKLGRRWEAARKRGESAQEKNGPRA